MNATTMIESVSDVIRDIILIKATSVLWEMTPTATIVSNTVTLTQREIPILLIKVTVELSVPNVRMVIILIVITIAKSFLKTVKQ